DQVWSWSLSVWSKSDSVSSSIAAAPIAETTPEPPQAGHALSSRMSFHLQQPRARDAVPTAIPAGPSSASRTAFAEVTVANFRERAPRQLRRSSGTRPLQALGRSLPVVAGLLRH